jgi:hypothetical protein
MDDGRCLESRLVPENGVVARCESADGMRVIADSKDHKDNAVYVWNAGAGSLLFTLVGHTNSIYQFRTTPSGHHLLTAGEDRKINLWDLRDGVLVRTFEGHGSAVTALAVTPDGKHVLSGSKTIRLWDLESGRCIRVFEGHTEKVCCIGVTANGRGAVSCGWDKTVRIWDLVTGEQVSVVAHDGDVWSVATTPDGLRVVSGGEDKTLRVWDIVTGKCLAVFTADGAIETVTLSANTICCGDNSGVVTILFPTTPLITAVPFVTVTRLWEHGHETGGWKNQRTIICAWCGTLSLEPLFDVRPTGLIQCSSPDCRKPMILNDFVCDPTSHLPESLYANVAESRRELRDRCMVCREACEPPFLQAANHRYVGLRCLLAFLGEPRAVAFSTGQCLICGVEQALHWIENPEGVWCLDCVRAALQACGAALDSSEKIGSGEKGSLPTYITWPHGQSGQHSGTMSRALEQVGKGGDASLTKTASSLLTKTARSLGQALS